MKVIHIAYFNSAIANIGVVKQMQSEKDLAKKNNIQLDVQLWSGDYIDNYDVICLYPEKCKTRLSKRLYFLKCIRKLTVDYDFVIVRYAPVDFFVPFWGFSKSNVLFVHHTKEGIALRNGFKSPLGFIFAFLDSIIAAISLNRAKGLIAVTGDILDYEQKRCLLIDKKTNFIYPNGIDYDEVQVCEDNRAGPIKVIFIASYFFDWHGLSQVLDSILRVNSHDGFELHLVGNVQAKDMELVNKLVGAGVVKNHGRLDTHEIKKLMANMDVGLASFSLELAGLNEACTLKVREYMAAGLPVYSGHIDSAFNHDFPFFKVAENFSFLELIQFCSEMRNVERSVVRNTAKKHINKVDLLKKLSNWLTVIRNT